jgi:hypothetical protein
MLHRVSVWVARAHTTHKSSRVGLPAWSRYHMAGHLRRYARLCSRLTWIMGHSRCHRMTRVTGVLLHPWVKATGHHFASRSSTLADTDSQCLARKDRTLANLVEATRSVGNRLSSGLSGDEGHQAESVQQAAVALNSRDWTRRWLYGPPGGYRSCRRWSRVDRFECIRTATALSNVSVVEAPWA